MTRAEYMEKLAQALKAYDEDFALDIIGDYRRHFDEAAADGRSEESVCEELGSVEDFIRDIPEEFKKNSDEKASGRTDSSKEASDYKDDFGKLAGDLGKLVNEAGKMAGIAAGKAAIKAAKSADSAISRLSEVISDKLSEVMSDVSNDMAENAADDNTADSSNEGAEHTCDRAAEFDNVDVEEYADIDFNKDNISNNVNNNNNSNVINRDINNSNTINSNVNDSNMNAGTAGAYAGNTALDIVNPLMVCSYTGLRGLKMSVVEPNVELVQADTAAITIILSRPLTKKEKMYMNPIVSVEDGILKVKQENKNKAVSFIYNPVNEPLTYFVTVPAQFEKLNVSTVSGGIYVDGDITAEECRLSTVSGSIKVQHDIHADKLKFNTVSGQIRTVAQLYAKGQEFSSVSGSVNAVVAGESFSAETVSGSVNLAVIGACSGKVNTVSGGIVIKLLSDIGIDIKCSGMSGSLKLMTDKHVVWDNYDEKNTMRFGFAKSDRHAVFGDGQARITSSSVSGSVKVYDFGKTE